MVAHEKIILKIFYNFFSVLENLKNKETSCTQVREKIF